MSKKKRKKSDFFIFLFFGREGAFPLLFLYNTGETWPHTIKRMSCALTLSFTNKHTLDPSYPGLSLLHAHHRFLSFFSFFSFFLFLSFFRFDRDKVCLVHTQIHTSLCSQLLRLCPKEYKLTPEQIDQVCATLAQLHVKGIEQMAQRTLQAIGKDKIREIQVAAVV